MYDHAPGKSLANPARLTPARLALALCLFAALGDRAVQAGAVAVTLPSQLMNPVTTAPYPAGTASSVVPSAFTVAAGGIALTFTAMNGTVGGGFRSVSASGLNAAPQFTAAPYGAVGDILEDTTFSSPPPTGNTNTGPLEIDFSAGVAGFGLLAQDYNQDFETFTLNVFDGISQIGTFTFGPVDNTLGLGQAVFVGARGTAGDVITRATLSSLSVASGPQPNNGNNDFAFGRAQVEQAPVPEASTMTGLGPGLLLCAGLAFGTPRRTCSRKGTSHDATGAV